MMLSALVTVLRAHHLLIDASTGDDISVASLAVDSRLVEPGTLFLAERGSQVDGHDFIASAIARGAVAVIAERALALPVPCVVVTDGRAAVRVLAAFWFDHPADRVTLVGITGTNGKTTTTTMVRHLLNAANDAGSIGTLGAFDADGRVVPSTAGSLTTPGALDLQGTFRRLVDIGVRRVAMECSSHALEQQRLDGLHYRVGVFTNLTREHLDYHGTMAAYLAAKLRLADLVAPDGVLAVAADDPAWAPLLADARTITWGTAPTADVRADHLVSDLTGTSFDMTGRFGARRVAIPFLGEFNVSNALAAATVALALGESLETVVDRLASAPQVPGRLERLAEAPVTVLRDYAHTPDAMQRVLATLRPLIPGRLLLLFGCGGDRDRGKRPVMGRVAAAGADLVMLTEDNPRTEDPERILDDIVAEMPTDSYRRCVDRAEGIRRLLAEARPGHLVLLAGKGHETYQIIGKEYLPFDEREIVREALAR